MQSAMKFALLQQQHLQHQRVSLQIIFAQSPAHRCIVCSATATAKHYKTIMPFTAPTAHVSCSFGAIAVRAAQRHASCSQLKRVLRVLRHIHME
jgi:hypothetical protein